MSLRERALVSVVIPTRRRPHLVVLAVESALRQSYSPIEVLVVVDGPDVETARALGGINDARLRLILLEENVGGSDARNIGVREARGEWVAFLDDDDQWIPEKIEKQLEAAENVLLPHPIISSRLRAYGPDGDQVLPRRLYATGGNMGEYLFCRDSFCYGDGMLQTSTLLTKRSLLCEVPFVSGLKRHQDWDWLLKVAAQPEVEIVMLPEILTLMRAGGPGESVSQGMDWKPSLAAGIYSAAYRIIDVASVPIYAIYTAATPRFFREGECRVCDASALAGRLLRRTIPYGVAMALLLCACSSLFPLVFGRSFQGSVEALRWLCLLPLIRGLHYAWGTTITGSASQWYRTATQLGVAGMNLLLNAALIPRWSWQGAAIASLLTDAALAAGSWVVLQYLRAKEDTRTIAITQIV